MKNLILILMFIIPSVVFSQRDGSKVMDVNNIDYRLLDSLIIVEINVVRDSLGNHNMNYSRVISDYVSKPRCQKLYSEQKVYHPDGRLELYTEKLETSILKESHSTHKFKGGVSVVDGFEICLFKRQSYKLVTYGDYAKSIVDLWETSRDHCYVVRDAYNKQIVDGKELFLMSGVSTKYGTYNGKNGFYTVLNLTVIYKRNM
jgi:hypothetical protein